MEPFPCLRRRLPGGGYFFNKVTKNRDQRKNSPEVLHSTQGNAANSPGLGPGVKQCRTLLGFRSNSD